MRPLIGITIDEGQTEARPGRPPLPRFELKQAYCEAVRRAGGIPLLLPFLAPDELQEVSSRLSGVVITGGAFDIGPEEYGEQARPGLGALKPERTRFERSVAELSLRRGLPVLGVCGGMQLLNVVLGGSLHQDLATEREGCLAHEQAHDPREPAHEVVVEAGTRLARLLGARPAVNTTHHQAVKALGAGLRISARAPDGVVEAIEADGESLDRTPFVVGVQWHPELLDDADSRALYAAFVEAAAAR